MSQEERESLRDYHHGKIPSISPDFRGLLPEWKRVDPSTGAKEFDDEVVRKYSAVMDFRIFDNVHFFIRCIWYQGELLVRQKLLDALVARDELVILKREYIRQQEEFKPDPRAIEEGYFPARPMLNRSELFRDSDEPIRECLNNSHEVVEGVTNLWEVTAQLTRSFYRLGLPMRGPQMTLSNLLKRVYSDSRFTDLITHTEFSVDSNGRGSYRSGSVLDRLKSYRNTAAHLIGVQVDSFFREPWASLPPYPFLYTPPPPLPLTIYDHVNNSQENIYVPAPEELAALAEDSYRHYATGYEIVERGMKTFLRDNSLK